MSTKRGDPAYKWESTGPGGCDSHCIEHPCGPCQIHYEQGSSWDIADGSEDEECQHEETDHGICDECGEDISDELAARAEAACEGDR